MTTRRNSKEHARMAQKGKLAIFAVGAILLSMSTALGAIVAVDLYLHKRYESQAGINWKGYRGKIVGRKQPGERRLVVVGGSTAFGYGVGPDQSFPAFLERQLNARRQSGEGPFRVVNLAYNNEG